MANWVPKNKWSDEIRDDDDTNAFFLQGKERDKTEEGNSLEKSDWTRNQLSLTFTHSEQIKIFYIFLSLSSLSLGWIQKQNSSSLNFPTEVTCTPEGDGKEKQEEKPLVQQIPGFSFRFSTAFMRELKHFNRAEVGAGVRRKPIGKWVPHTRTGGGWWKSAGLLGSYVLRSWGIAEWCWCRGAIDFKSTFFCGDWWHMPNDLSSLVMD